MLSCVRSHMAESGFAVFVARYDVEWKDVNIVGDSEDAAKNVMDGAFMVICKAGASVWAAK